MLAAWWAWSGVAYHWIVYVLAFAVGLGFGGWRLYERNREDEYVIDWRRPAYLPDPDLPGRDPSLPAPTAGEHHPDPDTWDHLDPDQAADILIAEWHDEPPADWPASPDVWDAWWAGMDGLERECLKVTRWRQREQQLWAELKAETRELCGVAA